MRVAIIMAFMSHIILIIKIGKYIRAKFFIAPKRMLKTRTTLRCFLIIVLLQIIIRNSAVVNFAVSTPYPDGIFRAYKILCLQANNGRNSSQVIKAIGGIIKSNWHNSNFVLGVNALRQFGIG